MTVQGTGKCHSSARSGVQGQSDLQRDRNKFEEWFCYPSSTQTLFFLAKFMAGQDTTVLPLNAAAAVFQRSDPVPADTVVVEGPDFDQFIDLQALLSNYHRIGFQASSLGRAIDVVNKMVNILFSLRFLFSLKLV